MSSGISGEEMSAFSGRGHSTGTKDTKSSGHSQFRQQSRHDGNSTSTINGT
jgi:hypothetical protein